MRRYSVYGAVATIVILATLVGVQAYVRTLGPRAKARVIKAISDRFDADVSLGDLEITLVPSPMASGGPLSIRHHGWDDPRPLIYIAHFTADTNLFNLFLQRDKVRLVRVEGLRICVPRRGSSASRTIHDDDEELEPNQPANDRTQLKIGIETMVADGAVLEIEPRQSGKEPLHFEIAKLTLHSVGPSQPMRFEAALTNPKPPGLIHTTGHFGPWQKEDPRATAVSGDYRFSNADLSVFKGISGVLSSTGQYRGVLQHIEVEGQTDTPNFALKRGGSPVHLEANFQSIVNGMNGDTILKNVDARFLHSEFLCKGHVAREDGAKGKTVRLSATTTRAARMEDILQLVVGDKKPLMTGDVRFQTKIVVPPGKEDVIDKLQLNGRFNVSSAIFTSPDVNQKIVTLSDRASGITAKAQKADPKETVASDLTAEFRLSNGIMSLEPLAFSVPGALVKVTGTFDMPSRRLDLAGLFRMQSTLSGTQSGVKRLLLKPLDPVFRKDGAGLQVPFEVKGPQDHPTLSVIAFHHTFHVK